MKTGQHKVIVADDHPLFRQGLKSVIESDKSLLVTQEAGDGIEALRAISEICPEVAILDIDMPGLGGLSVARKVQEQKLGTALIFLTLYKEEDIFNEAMNAGGKGYVLKESAVTDILQCIHAVLEGKRFISPAISGFLSSRTARSESLAQEKPGLTNLTKAERRILKLIADDRTSKEIADELDLNVRAVENHRANICVKLDLRGGHSLAKFAFENRSNL